MEETTIGRTVIETRKDVQTRQVKGGHVVLLFTRTFYSDGSSHTGQEDCVASTGAEVAALVTAHLN